MCAACTEEYNQVGEGIMPPCGHVLCTDCFDRFVKIQVESKQMVECPTCAVAVPGWLVRRVLPEIGDGYAEVEAMHFGQVDGLNLRQCPVTDCGYRYPLHP